MFKLPYVWLYIR